jgi:hypothetical protein
MEEIWFQWRTNPLYQDMLERPITVNITEARKKKAKRKRAAAKMERKRRAKHQKRIKSLKK